MKTKTVLIYPLLLCLLMHGFSFAHTYSFNSHAFSNTFGELINAPKTSALGTFRVNQTLRSSIGITQPNSNTIWSIPDPAELEWNTMDISATKTIRFFLAKDDMVVQELGTFENTGKANGIVLAKNIGSGDNYQVVGIELFPDDKFHIAKFATPYFSIRNKVSDERKNRSRLLNAAPKKVTKAITSVTPKRKEFDGRNISYKKELTFSTDKILIKIWDHGRQDGDIVSIYLNGYTIISKHLLTYHKKSIEIKLDPSKKNDLFLYAHNLGEFAPNTVSLEISDGKTSENIILNSDLKSCEAVMISVKK